MKPPSGPSIGCSLFRMQVWSRAFPIYRVVEGNPDSPRGKEGRNKNGIGSRSTPHEIREMAAKDSENGSPMTYSWVDVETTYEVRGPSQLNRTTVSYAPMSVSNTIPSFKLTRTLWCPKEASFVEVRTSVDRVFQRFVHHPSEQTRTQGSRYFSSNTLYALRSRTARSYAPTRAGCGKLPQPRCLPPPPTVTLESEAKRFEENR